MKVYLGIIIVLLQTIVSSNYNVHTDSYFGKFSLQQQSAP